MDPRLKLAMIMLFFQAVQLKNKAVQLVMLELERVCTPGKGEKQMARIGRNGEVFPVCIRRARAFILTVDKGKHGTSSGGCAAFVLDGLARLSRRVCAVFVLVLCPGSVLPQSRERLYRQWTRGRHGTSSGGCAAFWVNINGVSLVSVPDVHEVS